MMHTLCSLRRWAAGGLLSLFAGAAVLIAQPPPPEAAVDVPIYGQPGETPAQRDARMKWWREARFGMFIHWGLYAVPAGTWQGEKIPGIGEWIMLRAKIPVKDYAAFAQQFNPVKYDADAWVRLAKEAGMKYIIITSKHHDGFALFNSGATKYDIVDATPYKRDVLKDLAAACQKHGVKLGFYYSQAQDWFHPGGAKRGGAWDPAHEGSMDDYIRDIAVPQVKEILTNYGPIAVLWWDTPVDMNKQRAEMLLPLIKLQPGLITNNRLGGGYLGDTETPENRIPATGYPGGRDWEACMTMNDTWGFKSYDTNWKSGEQLIRTLIDIASKGGNYLLNVGPTAEGEIPQPSIERLQQVGAWMKQNGDSIYATTASPFKRLGWGRATQKPNKLYLHVFDWPADGALVVPMRNKARKAYLLSAPRKALKLQPTPEGLRIQLPAQAPDAIASVVVVEGAGKIDPLPPAPIAQPASKEFDLSCDTADLFGKTLRVEGNTQLNLTGWRTNDDYAKWSLEVHSPGEYEVELLAYVSPASAGGEYVLALGDQQIRGKTAETDGNYRPHKLGTIRVDRAGPVDLTIKPTKINGEELMRLRAVRLRPVGN